MRFMMNNKFVLSILSFIMLSLFGLTYFVTNQTIPDKVRIMQLEAANQGKEKLFAYLVKHRFERHMGMVCSMVGTRNE
jgi:hypothetical protein